MPELVDTGGLAGWDQLARAQRPVPRRIVEVVAANDAVLSGSSRWSHGSVTAVVP